MQRNMRMNGQVSLPPFPVSVLAIILNYKQTTPTSPPIKKRYTLTVVDRSCCCALSGIMIINCHTMLNESVLSRGTKINCLSLRALWSADEWGWLQGKWQLPTELHPFYSSSNTLHPPLPRFLSSSLKVENERWLVSVWRESLERQLVKQVKQTCIHPPYAPLSFLTLLCVPFFLFLSLNVWERTSAQTILNSALERFSIFCVFSLFLSTSLPPALSLFF